MVEQDLLKAYITVPYTPETSAVLLKEREKETFIVNIDGDIFNSKYAIPKNLLEDLVENKKATITPTKVIVREGKDKVFNIPLTRSRTFTWKKEKFIRIRILADNITTLMEHVSDVKLNLAKYNIEPKVCVWTQNGTLNRKKRVAEMPKRKVEFDQEEMKEQMLMELEANRRNDIGTSI